MKRRLFLRNALATTAGAFVVPTIIPSYVIGKNASLIWALYLVSSWFLVA